MPANSNSFNRFLLLFSVLLGLQLVLIGSVQAQLPQLSPDQLNWLGERVFENECSSRHECLTSWNQGEDFPSLGIGHFIWYQANQNEVFEETFPALLESYRQANYLLPFWIEALPSPDSPWRSREQFHAQLESQDMRELRDFLAATTAVQVEFIVRRLHNSIPELLAQSGEYRREAIEQRFYTLANSQAPSGIYALIDYVHFKGTGLNSQERYQGQGWGLLQVLIEMGELPPGLDKPPMGDSLEGFISAATTVLQRRVSNAPAERREQRWIAGWTNRLQGYLRTAP